MKVTHITNELKVSLTIKNEKAEMDYHKGIISMWAYNDKKVIHFYEKEKFTDNYFVPLTVVEKFKESDIVCGDIDIDMNFNPKPLRKEQVEAMSLVYADDGNSKIIACPTGFGKSRMIIELIRTHRKRCLILVCNNTLLKQMKGSIDEYRIKTSVYGGGSKDMSGDVVIMTVQSFYGLDAKTIEALPFEIVFVDEVHKFMGDITRSAILKLPSKRIYAFSATPFTDAIKEDGMQLFWGHIIKYGEVNIIPKIYAVEDDTCSPNADVNKYSLFRTEFDMSQKRLDKQIEIIQSLINDYGRNNILVLYDRIIHTEYVAHVLAKKIPCVSMAHGEMDKELRMLSEQRFRRSGGVLVANDAVAGVGFDVPMIDTVCLFFPNKFDGRIIQMVGRALRKYKYKENAWVIDWVDEVLDFQFMKRMKAYKNEYGIDVEFLYNAPKPETTDLF